MVSPFWSLFFYDKHLGFFPRGKGRESYQGELEWISRLTWLKQPNLLSKHSFLKCVYLSTALTLLHTISKSQHFKLLSSVLLPLSHFTHTVNTSIHINQQLRSFCNGDLNRYWNAILSYLKVRLSKGASVRSMHLGVQMWGRRKSLPRGLEMREMFSTQNLFIFWSWVNRMLVDRSLIAQRQLIVEPY